MNLVTKLTGFLALDWRHHTAEIFINQIRRPISSVSTDSIKVNVFQISMLPPVKPERPPINHLVPH